MIDPSAERWLPVVGYEGLYEVSDHGRVRSVDRTVQTKSGPRVYRGRLLRTHLNNTGRENVSLWRAGVGPGRQVSVLVAEAFIGPRPAGHECCHNDGDELNNRLDNLRWDTKSGNERDKLAHGTHNHANKQRCIRGHLLVPPNLRPTQLAQGARACLACGRAHGRWSYARKKGWDFDMQIESDMLYERIMQTSEVA